MLSKLIYTGVQPEQSLSEIKRIKLLNEIVLLYISGVFLKFLMELFVWDTIGLSIAAIIMGVFSVAMILNHLGKLVAARIYFTVIFTFVLCMLNLLYGHFFGSEFAFFPLIMVVIIFFEDKKIKSLWIAFVALCYIASLLFIKFNQPIFLDNLSDSVFYFMFFVSFIGVFLMSNMFISENKHFEVKTNQLLETLKTKNKHLETANNELEKFAYVASHDLKTPLRNIHSFLTLIQRKISKGQTEDIGEYLEFASQNAHRMHELIQDVLEFSQFSVKKVSFETKDLNRVMEYALNNLHEIIKEKNAIVNVVPLPTLICNDSQMLSLFQNLIENGLKYNNNSQPKIDITCVEKPTEYNICIADNGIGIEEEYQDKVFEMFYRLHNQGEYSGSGIGLATCRKIVSHHGGKLSLVSSLNKGSTFCINFPKRIQAESLKKSTPVSTSPQKINQQEVKQ
ncbi:MAG: ATP-binding protein [Chitinophagales bacterium]